MTTLKKKHPLENSMMKLNVHSLPGNKIDDVQESDEVDGQRCLSCYDGDETLSPGRGGEEPVAESREENSGTMDDDDDNDDDINVEATRTKVINCIPLTLDTNAASISAAAAAAATSAAADFGSSTGLFKVPESPAAVCKLNGGGCGGVSSRGRKTSLTGISTGSNGSNSSSGVSSMTSEQFDAAIIAATSGGGCLGVKGDASSSTNCSTLDLAGQRRTNGSSSSFSVEEEDANDVYSR